VKSPIPWIVCVGFIATSSLQAAEKVHVATIPPRPEDVATVDGVVKAYYEVVTGPAGQPRDWARDRTLYVPDVRFVMVTVGKDGKPTAHVMSHQEFVEESDAPLRKGFYEKELKRDTWQWGSLAQVRSSYETRHSPDGPIVGRGVNTLGLVHDGKRWWIAGATWQDESPGLVLPAPLGP
jgi:hypothetical protein